MPSQRRVRLLFLAIFAGVIFTLVYTSHLRAHQSKDSRTIQDFYHKTVSALDREKPPTAGQTVLDAKTGKGVGHTPSDKDADGDIDEDDKKMAQEMSDRLKAAEQKAKDLANQKALKPDAPSEVIGVGSSAEGQAKKGKAKAKAAGAEDKEVSKAEEADDESGELAEEEQQVEAELNSILKKSPIIIFSKTYCQYSKRAKGLLLEKYLIEPAPFVVELDTHPLGKLLQSRLAEKTGRATVPNIMVNGVSIGGSDDIAEMDAEKTLAGKIKDLTSKKVTVKERFIGGESTDAKGHAAHEGHASSGRSSKGHVHDEE